MKKNKSVYSNANPRIPIFYAIFGFLFTVLVLGLGYRQIYMNDYYVQRSDRQSLRRVIKPAARGDIFDRNGKLLVTNKPRYSAVVFFNDISEEIRSNASKIRANAEQSLRVVKNFQSLCQIQIRLGVRLS